MRDARIHYRHLEENYGISGNTNAALEMAAGDFIVLADHDDLLEPDALFRMMEVLEQDPGTDVIYTDEGKITMDGSRILIPILSRTLTGGCCAATIISVIFLWCAHP